MATESVPASDFWDWYAAGRDRARSAAVPLGDLDWLVLAFSELDRLALRLGPPGDPAATVTLRGSLAELDRRWQARWRDRWPVQYLAGSVRWRSLDLVVSPAVLIPRPETELLVELAIAARPDPVPGEIWADLGSGSGAIALGFALARPLARVLAVDCSADALAIARENARRNGLWRDALAEPRRDSPGERLRDFSPETIRDRAGEYCAGEYCAGEYYAGERRDRASSPEPGLEFRQGSWFAPLDDCRGKLAGAISNPPYIPSGELAGLEPEVARHEPHLALDGGPDGLDCIRHLIAAAPDYLQPGGVLIFEMMAGQAASVADAIARQGSYRDLAIRPDLAGIDRFALAYRR